ncbi:ABC transporter ATP-binding protein [Tundrisphaera sp. TA3]|uniref:ABC transporter ATP-binding protein n=1 Tax=Tundrisphaera sp. TA3 TaxID=3435775 RepID=UPI003EB7AEA3
MARLVLDGVRKTFPGGVVAVDGVDLAIESGELFVIVGPSGSGKSTLLRLTAGLEALDAGSISLGGRRIDGLAPRDRGVAMIFQGQVLYPHLNVFDNLAFGLRARKKAGAEIDAEVRAVADTLGLGKVLDRAVATLSGGQRQRVALGRAMALRPDAFLLDEPFTGLDAPLRASTRAELADLRSRLGSTMVMVTHDQSEAMALADRLAVLDHGRLVQVGTPQEVYDNPASRFVARFIGHPPMNLVPGLVAREGDGLMVRILDADHLAPFRLHGWAPWLDPMFAFGSPRVDFGLRAEHFRPLPARGETPPHGTVVRLEPTGPETLATIVVGSHRVAAWIHAHSPIRVGDPVHLVIQWQRACVYDPETGRRLGLTPPAG